MHIQNAIRWNATRLSCTTVSDIAVRKSVFADRSVRAGKYSVLRPSHMSRLCEVVEELLVGVPSYSIKNML